MMTSTSMRMMTTMTSDLASEFEDTASTLLKKVREITTDQDPSRLDNNRAQQARWLCEGAQLCAVASALPMEPDYGDEDDDDGASAGAPEFSVPPRIGGEG
jgi:hypothetical protein